MSSEPNTFDLASDVPDDKETLFDCPGSTYESFVNEECEDGRFDNEEFSR